MKSSKLLSHKTNLFCYCEIKCRWPSLLTWVTIHDAKLYLHVEDEKDIHPLLFSINFCRIIKLSNVCWYHLLREVIKKKTVMKRSGWPIGLTPPPMNRSGKCEIFLLWFFTLVYDYIRPKTNFTKKKKIWPPKIPLEALRDTPWYPRF